MADGSWQSLEATGVGEIAVPTPRRNLIRYHSRRAARCHGKDGNRSDWRSLLQRRACLCGLSSTIRLACEVGGLLSIPNDLSNEILRCKTDEDVEQVGTEWLLHQSKDLKKNGVPVLHYYTLGKPHVIANVVREL